MAVLKELVLTSKNFLLYIKIQAEKNADLENEITQAQIAMCEIYEMMG